MSGIVYILTNPYIPELAFIGHFDVGTLEKEIQRLDSEGVPGFFTCEYSMKVKDAEKAEEDVRANCDAAFVWQERGFFKKEFIAQAKKAIEGKRKVSKERYNFSKMGIEKGEILNFTRNPSIMCVVYNDNQVELLGKPCALSRATIRVYSELLKDIRDTGQYQGGEYWSYKGKLIQEIWNNCRNKQG